jgi:hypothetical protein
MKKPLPASPALVSKASRMRWQQLAQQLRIRQLLRSFERPGNPPRRVAIKQFHAPRTRPVRSVRKHASVSQDLRLSTQTVFEHGPDFSAAELAETAKAKI